MNFIQNFLTEIKNLCEANKVKTLFASGSVVNENFTMESDVDLIVDFQ